MSDAKRVARPLSPHLQVYRMPLNAVLSILHRITGAAMAGSAILILWWFLAAATSPAAFDLANGILTSWIGDLVLSLSALAIWFHFTNGIRHLVWDTGAHFGRKRVRITAYIGLTTTVILTLITLIIA
ncbi:MAG TPA: succinate dehydrogenase, cytochrome b556 subunit [Aliiroseovarius sp.]|nr:succinate dehydrogenase, cytochrome b556 subunit [Aliiroseovarius sp.]